jgi:hypothetical protein|tara:strand:- start:429 stop:686 length:258 start_codon:yes stop_codon:yes gene_type:complete
MPLFKSPVYDVPVQTVASEGTLLLVNVEHLAADVPLKSHPGMLPKLSAVVGFVGALQFQQFETPESFNVEQPCIALTSFLINISS